MTNTMPDQFIASLRLECIKLANAGSPGAYAADTVKEAEVFFNFISNGEVPENKKVTEP